MSYEFRCSFSWSIERRQDKFKQQFTKILLCESLYILINYPESQWAFVDVEGIYRGSLSASSAAITEYLGLDSLYGNVIYLFSVCLTEAEKSELRWLQRGPVLFSNMVEVSWKPRKSACKKGKGGKCDSCLVSGEKHKLVSSRGLCPSDPSTSQ